MDGLSAAASGIAVVSLAIQLVDSVRQIQRFLRNVSEAPKELGRLLDLLEQLELILESIGELINRQQQQSGDQDVAVSEIVLRAMKTCENTVKGLASTVEGSRKSVEAKSKMTKTLACFRLSCMKKDIEEFEGRIHEAVNLLNLTITTNLMAMHSRSIGNLLTQVMATNQITTTISQELVLLRNSAPKGFGQSCPGALATVGVCTKRSRKPLRPGATNGRSTMTRTPLGTIIIRKESATVSFENVEEGSSADAHTREQSTWIFIPSFFSRCIEVRYSKTWGDIQGALRTHPVIRDNHPVWKMCRNWDVQGIQKLFSEQQLSPFSINCRGKTLLQYSVTFCRWEVCKILFQVGNTGNELDISSNPILVAGSNEGAEALEKTCDLVTSHVDDPDISSFACALFYSYVEPSIHLYHKMINLWIWGYNAKVVFLQESPIPMALKMLWLSQSTTHEPWKQAIRRVLRLGIDLHTILYNVNGRSITLLDEILDRAEQPFESKSLGQKWLEILSESGFDIVEYLSVELKIRYNPSQTLSMMEPQHWTDNRDRYLMISKEPPSVSWEWYIDPTGTAFDVLQEFKDLELDFKI